MQLEFTPCNPDNYPGILRELGIHRFHTAYDCVKTAERLQEFKRKGDDQNYYDYVRVVSKDDFFCFCYFCLGLPVNHPFLIARCYEIQEQSHMTVDLWAREHWKSTLLTMALPLWELIEFQDERICIFSNTRALAKKHLRALKMMMQENDVLKYAFPEIFWENPEKQAPKWSENDGLFVRRTKTFKDASIEAWGLVDGLPTGSRFTIRIYDDIIDTKNVNTGAQIEKATDMFKNSQALCAKVRRRNTRTGELINYNSGKQRIIGTRYSLKDTYDELIKNKRFITRIYPSEVDEHGKFKRGGYEIHMSREALEEKYDIWGDYVYSAQMGQNPVSSKNQKFRKEWLTYYKPSALPTVNKYIFVDPASSKSADADWCVMSVIGAAYMRNYYLVDMVRDRLNLGERWQRLRDLVLEHNPIGVGYEKYGMQADIEYFEMQMEEEGVHFSIEPLAGPNQTERIKRLVPLFQKHRFIIPRALLYYDINGDVKELIQALEEEYLAFPYGHFDILDSLSRIFDMPVTFPMKTKAALAAEAGPDPLDLFSTKRVGSWMAQ